MRWIYGLNEINKGTSDLVGKKCANLGELIKAGFRVPNGFALTLTAYEKFMEEIGIINEIKQYLKAFSADPNEMADIIKYEEASRVIRQMVESKDMPVKMEATIAQYYQNLYPSNGICKLSVAIRSSGPVSHPGQYETFLHISEKSNVIKHIIKVWSSTFNHRSLIARHRLGLPLYYDPIGVGVIQMVNAKAAGVMFTLNPTKGDPSKIMIEANWGFGESVVSGSVTPDRWMMDKVTFEIIEKVVSQKLVEHVIDPKTDKPCLTDIPPERQNVPCLSEEEVLGIAKVGKEIERHFGIPQDIEWALSQDWSFPEDIFFLQTRPAQIMNEKEIKPVLGTGKTSLDFLLDIATQGKL